MAIAVCILAAMALGIFVIGFVGNRLENKNVQPVFGSIENRFEPTKSMEADGRKYAYYEQDFKGSCALILGSEGEGVSDILKKESDFIAGIPMYGTVNSLNVSNAGAIVMFEAAKQRNS